MTNSYSSMDRKRLADDLATRRYNAGDTAGAIRIYEDLVADQIRILGPDYYSGCVCHIGGHA
jgi:hypothetical protein